jgi:hypothetical protein
LLKIYTLPKNTITIGVCILDIQLIGLLYGGGASVLLCPEKTMWFDEIISQEDNAVVVPDIFLLLHRGY